MENDVQTKVCPGCQLEKSASEFGKANRRDGLRSYCKACEKIYQKTKITSLRERIHDKLGHACCRCGFADKRALQIDHINGGGNKEHKQIKNNESFLNKVLLDNTGSYQILCANCNWIKRMENREHSKENTISEEGLRKIIESNKERQISDESKQRMSDSHLGQLAWNKGKSGLSWGNKWTEEQKANQTQVALKREAAKRSKRAEQRQPSE